MRNANVAGTAGLTLIMGIGKVQKCPSTPLRLATQDDDYAYGKLREGRSIRGGNPGEIVSYHSLPVPICDFKHNCNCNWTFLLGLGLELG